MGRLDTGGQVYQNSPIYHHLVMCLPENTLYRRCYKLHNHALLLCAKQKMDFFINFRKEFIKRDKLEHTTLRTQTRSYAVTSLSRNRGLLGEGQDFRYSQSIRTQNANLLINVLVACDHLISQSAEK